MNYFDKASFVAAHGRYMINKDDEDAKAELGQAIVQVVRGYLHSRCSPVRNAHQRTVEEAEGESIMACWIALRKFDPDRGSPLAFLTRVTQNSAYNTMTDDASLAQHELEVIEPSESRPGRLADLEAERYHDTRPDPAESAAQRESPRSVERLSDLTPVHSVISDYLASTRSKDVHAATLPRVIAKRCSISVSDAEAVISEFIVAAARSALWQDARTQGGIT